eukprot:2751512-Amphidinium_carterae.1
MLKKRHREMQGRDSPREHILYVREASIANPEVLLPCAPWRKQTSVKRLRNIQKGTWSKSALKAGSAQ